MQLDPVGTLEGGEQVASCAVAAGHDAVWLSSNRYLALLPGAAAKLGRPADRAAAPERLAAAAEIIREDLPACLDTYLGRPPTSSPAKAAAELVTQLGLVAGAVDRLAAAVPDVHAQRAEDLTEELRRRHGAPPP